MSVLYGETIVYNIKPRFVTMKSPTSRYSVPDLSMLSIICRSFMHHMLIQCHCICYSWLGTNYLFVRNIDILRDKHIYTTLWILLLNFPFTCFIEFHWLLSYCDVSVFYPTFLVIAIFVNLHL